VGPGGSLVVQAQVEFTSPFEGSAQETWEAEYQRSVVPEDFGRPALLRLPDAHEISELWELGPEDPFAFDGPREPELLDLEHLVADFDRE